MGVNPFIFAFSLSLSLTSADRAADGSQGRDGPGVQRCLETVVREGQAEGQDGAFLEGLVLSARRATAVGGLERSSSKQADHLQQCTAPRTKTAWTFRVNNLTARACCSSCMLRCVQIFGSCGLLQHQRPARRHNLPPHPRREGVPPGYPG